MPQTVECPSTVSGVTAGEGGLTLCWGPQGACITLLYQNQSSLTRAAQSLTSAWKKKIEILRFKLPLAEKKEAGTELQKGCRSRLETNNLTMRSKHCSINTHHWVQNLHSHPHKQLKEAPLSQVHSQMYVYFYCHLQEESDTTLNSHPYDLFWDLKSKSNTSENLKKLWTAAMQ